MLYLPELIELEKIITQAKGIVRIQQHGDVQYQQQHFPIYSLSLGSTAPDAPTIGFFAGVHGLERIGSLILLAFLRGLLHRLQWDSSLQQQLKTLRLVFMPLVNPIGMARGTRSNADGIDLMRNAPVEASPKAALLVGGHRYSARLPWFRGEIQTPMAIENQALCEVVETFLYPSSFSMALDCHSGFGLRDRIWFPYAHTQQPIPQLAEVYALKHLFDQSYPHHPYVIEPQSRHYRTHGDIWDYLHLRHQSSARIFLPFTLELGSWLWIKKNPRQLLSLLGLFNPIVPHRLQRVLRSHLVLLEFLLHATHDHQQWLPQSLRRMECHHQAFELWYRGKYE